MKKANKRLKAGQIFINDKDIVSRIIEKQAVIILLKGPKENEEFFTLNESGTRIWQLLTKKCKTDDISRIICSEYKISPDKARNEISKFVNVLAKKKIISIR